MYENVVSFLLDGKDSARCALRFLNEDLTYGDLQERSERVARALIVAGGQKGDRILLVADNSPFWIITYLGVLRAGLVCVPLATGISTDHLSYILEITGAKIVFAQRAFAIRNSPALHRLRVITDKDELTCNEASTLPLIHPDDLAALMFTSGSTGQPRGVMISHANIIANTRSIIECLSLTEADRIMVVLPFHYCFGTSLLHTHLAVGGTLVVDERFLYPETVLQRMIETECTGFAGVPSHFQILLSASGLRKKPFTHLRYVQQAGGHLAPRFVRDLREALPHTQIFIMYGQTEATARLSCLPPEFLDAKPGSIGRGVPGVELGVLDESGAPVGPGQIGEIVARGKNVALGYWADPAESPTTFREGTLHTGDLGTVDEDGFIYVVDRAKDFLKCGGERVSCRHLEDQILAFDELSEAAVIGMPDEVLGESVKAFVVPRPGNSPGLTDRLTRFCKDRLPPRLMPREIIVLEALPKNSSGKILKMNLKKL